MARSRDPEHYPRVYQQYLEDVGLRKITMRVPKVGALPDDEASTGLQKGLKLRGHFYAFIGALKRARKEGGPNAEKWATLANYADQTMVYLDKAQCALYFTPRDKAWQAMLLASGGAVDQMDLDEVDASLARVQAGLTGEQSNED